MRVQAGKGRMIGNFEYCNARQPVKTGVITRCAVAIVLLIGLAGCGFFVDATLTSIAVAPNSATISVGATQQLTATGTFDDSSTEDKTNSVTWSSSDSTIATVSTAGLVTGVKAGSATITATSGNFTSTSTITVTATALASIAISPTSATLNSGGTQQFTATGTFGDGSTSDLTSQVTWASSNTAALAISTSGLATAQTVAAAVTVNVTATSGSITSNTATVTINP